MKRTLYTYFTDRNQIAQPDATRVLGPIVAMPIHKKDDNDSLYNMLPEVVVTAKYPHEQRVIDTMNASNAEFMRRLRNNDKRAIHNQDGSYSTHVLGNADNMVFPAIQDVNGVLEDYRSLPWQRTLDKAIQNKDYIEFPTEGDARYFGEHYKKYFPEFFSHFGDNQYAEGGEIEKPKHWNELSMADKSDAIASAVRNGVTTLEDIRKAWDDYADSGYREDSSYRDNSEDMGNTLDDYDDTYQEETHEYLKGGYKPSAAIKNRIANWEGSSMQTNRSFEAEAKDFWNAIPSNVRSKLTQQQADALYSYSYNVGAGNFKKRVVPSLERYFNGNGSVEDVQRHMYATKDKDYRGLAKRRAVERAMFGGQRVEDVSSFDYDYSSNSSPYGHRFTVNNNFQTAGYLGPIVNGNNVNGGNTNKTNVFLQALEDGPKQTIAESTPEPRYNALERLQNIYSMYGMDDYAQEIGKYNPFKGLMFAEGGKKSTDTKGVTSSNGQYHVNPTDYLDVLSNVENNKPVEVTLPDVTVKAVDPKNYRSSYDPNGFMDFMNTVTLGAGNRFSVSQNARLLKDAYDAVTGNKSWEDVVNSAILGNNGIFDNPYANMALDIVVPTVGGNYRSIANATAKGVQEVSYAMGRYAPSSVKDFIRGKIISKELDKLNPRPNISTPTPIIRTKAGDVEVDDPNLFYHLDRGNSAGAFSSNGAHIDNGMLYPGKSKDVSQTSYSWWNKGKPYAYSVGEEPLTRMVTSSENPSLIKVRDQNYPIGQWNGKSGFVLNSEYVSSSPIDVSNSTYVFDPSYGWRKIDLSSSTIDWNNAIFAHNFAHAYGGKMYDDGGVTSSNGQYHVNPADYWAVLGNAENEKSVEVTTPEVTVTAADPKKYRSDFHSEDIFPFMNIATAGLLNRGGQ